MQQRHPQTNEIEELYRMAVEYDRRGDVYNAVKLCKLIVRKSPDWSAPYAYLSHIYKGRTEWKPTLHYSLKAIEYNPFNEGTWENMALAATALEDWKTARQAWNQLGFKFKNIDEELRLDLGLVPVRLLPNTQPEIVEATRIGPARAIIESIPQPSSGRRYKDLVLLDSKPNKSFVLHGRKLGVFDELQVLKESLWRTYALILLTPSDKDVDILANLCEEAGLGFDNWSNAARFFQSHLHPKVMEYYDKAVFGKLEREAFLVAIAAGKDQEVLEVLKNWEIISLKKYENLERLY
ncbi:MAG TPA: hypothetical protein ENJ95_23050 [Bacteroidetes bacterium]|nr:hypothetical protein [Bacteroidota bacterium]